MKLLRFCVFLLLCVLPAHAQENAPNFDDIFATGKVILVNAPSTPEPLPQITLPSSVDPCPPHSSGRLEVASPDGRYLVYGDCTFMQATELLNIRISLYDTQTEETFTIGSTPLYTSVWVMEWLDREHLVLIGEARGAIGGTSRGIMVVDTVEQKLVAIGGGPTRLPRLVPGTAIFEWIVFSFTEGNDYITYDALTDERQTLFDIPHNPLTYDETSLRAFSNRSATNLQPDLLAVAFWPGGDRSVTNIYDLTTAELLHEQETDNRYTSAYWINSSRLLLLDTDWRIPSAVLIEVDGDSVQTQTFDNIYVNHERPQVDGVLSMDHQYLLLRPNDDQVDVLDLFTMQQHTLVSNYPDNYKLVFAWTVENTLDATLFDGEGVIARWFLRLEVGNVEN